MVTTSSSSSSSTSLTLWSAVPHTTQDMHWAWHTTRPAKSRHGNYFLSNNKLLRRGGVGGGGGGAGFGRLTGQTLPQIPKGGWGREVWRKPWINLCCLFFSMHFHCELSFIHSTPLPCPIKFVPWSLHPTSCIYKDRKQLIHEHNQKDFFQLLPRPCEFSVANKARQALAFKLPVLVQVLNKMSSMSPTSSLLMTW